MHSQALVFDEKATLFYMNGILSETLLYGTEKLIRSNNDSLRFSSVMQRSWQPLSLRATVELDSVITYDFENNANNLTRKLKSQIAGSDEQEIRKILQNDANISKVQVKFSPFWLTKASSNIDNIEFILEKGE
jgi:phosphoribosylaminoimidazole carboxylase (NCAIR synthetase)